MTLSPQRRVWECDHGGVSDKRRERLMSYSGKNMVYSMLAVVGLAFAWWAIAPQPEEDQRRPVEVVQIADYAATQAGWPVWSPVLGEDWTANTAEFATLEGVPTWRTGWTSPETTYVALRQAVDPTDGWRQDVLRGMQQQEDLMLPGPAGEQAWQVFTGVSDNDEDEVSLVLKPSGDQPAVTIVHGTADVAQMSTFVGSLQVVASE